MKPERIEVSVGFMGEQDPYNPRGHETLRCAVCGYEVNYLPFAEVLRSAEELMKMHHLDRHSGRRRRGATA